MNARGTYGGEVPNFQRYLKVTVQAPGSVLLCQWIASEVENKLTWVLGHGLLSTCLRVWLTSRLRSVLSSCCYDTKQRARREAAKDGSKLATSVFDFVCRSVNICHYLIST
jgi:hypothetical protein